MDYWKQSYISEQLAQMIKAEENFLLRHIDEWLGRKSTKEDWKLFERHSRIGEPDTYKLTYNGSDVGYVTRKWEMKLTGNSATAEYTLTFKEI